MQNEILQTSMYFVFATLSLRCYIYTYIFFVMEVQFESVQSACNSNNGGLYRTAIAKFGQLFISSHFIRISILAQPNKRVAFLGIKLIVKIGYGPPCGASSAVTLKCNLCSVNEEELPCHYSNTKHWEEHVALTATPLFNEYQAALTSVIYSLRGAHFLVKFLMLVCIQISAPILLGRSCDLHLWWIWNN